MSLIIIYLISMILFWSFWLFYMPRYSFVHFLFNKELDNLKKDWDLLELETKYCSYSYFLLLNKKIDEVIIFDYNKQSNTIYIKDQRMLSYQENKRLTQLILKHYSKEELLNAINISQKEYKELKENKKQSFYYINGYDFQIKPKINIS